MTFVLWIAAIWLGAIAFVLLLNSRLSHRMRRADEEDYS